eukprot:4422311-Lingulodinium_polyedra.AAC.1
MHGPDICPNSPSVKKVRVGGSKVRCRVLALKPKWQQQCRTWMLTRAKPTCVCCQTLPTALRATQLLQPHHCVLFNPTIAAAQRSTHPTPHVFVTLAESAMSASQHPMQPASSLQRNAWPGHLPKQSRILTAMSLVMRVGGIGAALRSPPRRPLGREATLTNEPPCSNTREHARTGIVPLQKPASTQGALVCNCRSGLVRPRSMPNMRALVQDVGARRRPLVEP